MSTRAQAVAEREQRRRFFPVHEGPREAGRLPPWPRAVLGPLVVLPKVDSDWNVIPDTWVLPGCIVASSSDLLSLAAANKWSINFISKGATQ